VSATYVNGTEAEPPSNITISVQDINDNKQQFALGQHYVLVKERSPMGELIPNLMYGKYWPVVIGQAIVEKNVFVEKCCRFLHAVMA